jgi:hypothetical protein
VLTQFVWDACGQSVTHCAFDLTSRDPDICQGTIVELIELADGVVHESLNGQVARQLEGPKAEKTKPIRKPAHGAVDAGSDEEAALAAGLALGLQE